MALKLKYKKYNYKAKTINKKEIELTFKSINILKLVKDLFEYFKFVTIL